MGRKKDGHTLTVTAIRFPVETHDRLVREADARDLSINFLVNRAVDEFLERLIPVEEMQLTRTVERS